MHRRSKIVLLAAALCAISAAQVPKPVTPPKPTASASALDQTINQFNAPCTNAPKDRKSELCAQWNAADAAVDSAWWAWASGLLGIGSLLGVLAAIGLAYHSNRIARDTAKRQLRAYVFMERVSLRVTKSDFVFSIEWKNTGQTPAFDLECGCAFVFASSDSRDSASVDFSKPNTSVASLGPGGVRQIADFKVPVKNHIGLWGAGKCDLLIFTEARYKDSFGEPRFSKNHLRAKWSAEDEIPLLHQATGNEAT